MSVKNPIEKLIEQARIKGASRRISDGIAAEDVTEAQALEVVELVEAYRQFRQMSPQAIAKSIGVSSVTLKNLLAGKLAGAWGELAIDLDGWLETQIKRDAAPQQTEFVLTSVAEEIHAVADLCMTLKTIGLVFGSGSSGIGKTMALKAIAADKPGAVYISISHAATSPGGLLSAICLALRCDTHGSSTVKFHRLVKTLAGSGRLLLIDEIHKLLHEKHDRPLHVLRDLFDATQAPQLWCGTVDLLAYLDRAEGESRDPLSQIRRRIGIARDLTERSRDGGGTGPGAPLFTIEEIRRVFAGSKMRLSPDAVRYLWMLATLPDGGGLGNCRNLVTVAIKLHENASVLTADMLRAVQKLLVSRRAYETVESQMADSQPMRTIRTG